MTRVAKFGSIMAVMIGFTILTAGCDETTVQQAIQGLGITVSDDGSVTVTFGMDRPQGGDNANANANSNANINDNTGNTNTNSNDDRGNDNSPGGAGNTNGNTNTNTNTNSNTNDNDSNTNTNGNDNNSNDNTGGGICSDGSTRLEGAMESPVGLEAEYRRHPAGCARFRVKVRDYASGTYDILVNGVLVGNIQVDGDGRGEQEFDTSDGNFPADFPQMVLGDVVQVGAHSVTTGDDCSSTPDVCNPNGNTNTNGNANDNTGGNTNGNTNTNSNANDNG